MNLPKLLTLALTLGCSSLLHAQVTQTSWSPSSGDWNTPGFWTDGSVPGTNSEARIVNGGTATLSANQGTIYRIRVGGGAGGGLLQINAGGALAVSADSYISTGGTLSVSGTFTSASLFDVGNAATGTLLVNAGGYMSVTGPSSGVASNFTLARLENGHGIAVINSGTLAVHRTLRVGGANNTTAELTVKNGGLLTSSNSPAIALGGLNAATQYTGVTATLNIGGQTSAEGAGTVDVGSVTGYDSGINTNTNTVNFNHTSGRYHFRRPNNSAIALQRDLKVNLKAGVTVLEGANTYTRGTTLSNGAVLLANYATSNVNWSSTGQGNVTVEAGGTLGGIGWINGETTVSGILKPGDYDYEAETARFNSLKFRSNLTLESTARLELALNGATRDVSYSSLSVSGNLTLGGTVAVELLGGFSIAENETLDFQLFSVAGDLEGAFTGYEFAESFNGLGLEWDLSELNTTGWVSVTAVPEPSALFLLGAAAAGCAILRRKRG